MKHTINLTEFAGESRQGGIRGFFWIFTALFLLTPTFELIGRLNGECQSEVAQRVDNNIIAVAGFVQIPSTEVVPQTLIAPFGIEEAVAAQRRWAAHLKIDLTVQNSVGMNLILIPSGAFRMGLSNSEARVALSRETVQVRISRPFYVSTTEVTQKQWLALMSTRPWKNLASTKEDPDMPACGVQWNEARDFCAKLSEKEGIGYRLLSDSEWEFTCRAGSLTRFGFGERDSDLEKYAWFKANSLSSSHKVGLLKSNVFGVFDMHGNVSEWCLDRYSSEVKGGVDPVIDKSDIDGYVTRGGDWASGADSCWSALRAATPGKIRSSTIGFRIARVALNKREGNAKQE